MPKPEYSPNNRIKETCHLLPRTHYLPPPLVSLNYTPFNPPRYWAYLDGTASAGLWTIMPPPSGFVATVLEHSPQEWIVSSNQPAMHGTQARQTQRRQHRIPANLQQGRSVSQGVHNTTRGSGSSWPWVVHTFVWSSPLS